MSGSDVEQTDDNPCSHALFERVDIGVMEILLCSQLGDLSIAIECEEVGIEPCAMLVAARKASIPMPTIRRRYTRPGRGELLFAC